MTLAEFQTKINTFKDERNFRDSIIAITSITHDKRQSFNISVELSGRIKQPKRIHVDAQTTKSALKQLLLLFDMLRDKDEPEAIKLP